MSFLCPVMSKSDEAIAKRINRPSMFSAEQVAYIRTAYDQLVGEGKREALDWDKVEKDTAVLNKAASIIKGFGYSLLKKDMSSMMDIVSHFDTARRALLSNYRKEASGGARGARRVYNRRAAAISQIMAETVDALQKAHPEYSRAQLINGRNTPNGAVGGIEYINWQAKRNVLDKFNSMMEELIENLDYGSDGEFPSDFFNDFNILNLTEGLRETVDEAENNLGMARGELADMFKTLDKLQRVLENWEVLSIYALKEFSMREGVKPKIKLYEKIDEQDIWEALDYEDDTDMEEVTNSSHTTPWEKVSPLATMKPEILRMITSCPRYDYKIDSGELQKFLVAFDKMLTSLKGSNEALQKVREGEQEKYGTSFNLKKYLSRDIFDFSGLDELSISNKSKAMLSMAFRDFINEHIEDVLDADMSDKEMVETLLGDFIDSLNDTMVTPIKDDLGYAEYLNAETAYRYFSSLFDGIQDKYEISLRLASAKSHSARALREHLDSLPAEKQDYMLGEMFIAFKKSNETVREFKSKNGGLLAVRSDSNYNTNNTWFHKLMTNPESLSENFFAKRGYIDYEDLMRLYTEYYDNVGHYYVSEGNKNQLSKWRLDDFNDEMKPVILATFLGRLGIPITPDTANVLLFSTKGRKALTTILSQVDALMRRNLPAYIQHVANQNGLNISNKEGLAVEQFIDKDHLRKKKGSGLVNFELSEPLQKILNNGEAKFAVGGNTEKKVESFLKYKTGSNFASTMDIYSTILKTIADVNPENVQTYYRYIDRNGKKTKYFSHIAPSYLYNIADRVKSYVSSRDYRGFANWLNNTYIDNPLICKLGADGKVERFYNSIIERLYNSVFDSDGNASKEIFTAACNDLDSYVSNFAAGKILGLSNKKFADCNTIEHTEMMLSSFLETDRKNFTSKSADAPFCNIPMFILGDANCYKYMTGIRYSDTIIPAESLNESPVHISAIDKAVDHMYNVFLGEMERFKFINMGLNSEDANLRGAIQSLLEEKSNSLDKRSFIDLPFLNDAFSAEERGILQSGDTAVLDNPLYQSQYPNLTSARIKEIIRERLEKGIENQINVLAERGLIEKQTKDGVTTLVPKGTLLNHITDFYSNKDDSNIVTRNIIRDFYLSVKCNLIDQVNMFDGNGAFYQSVELLQKRNKQLHASGAPLDLNTTMYNGERIIGKDKMERCVYFRDPKHASYARKDMQAYNENFFEVLKQLEDQGILSSKNIKDYQEATITDGQGYRTLKSYRRLMILSKQWSDQLEKAYQRIQALTQEMENAKKGNSPLSEGDLKKMKYEICELAVSFKALKPFNYGFERLKIKDTNGVERYIMVPVQHKYAEAVIIPALLEEGSKLKAMAEWADIDEIGDDGKPTGNVNADVLLSEECVKVGGFNIMDLRTTDTMNTPEALKQYMTDNAHMVHKIPYSGFVIQGNTPDHMYESTLFGTQSRKMFLNGIDRTADRYGNYVGIDVLLEGEENARKLTSGNDIILFYNQLICADLKESYEEIKKELFGKAGMANIAKILSEGVFADTQKTISALEDFMLTEDEQFILPLFAPNISRDVQGVLLSMFKRAVNKQKIAGGSAVQVSPMGTRSFDDSGNLKFRTRPVRNADGSVATYTYNKGEQKTRLNVLYGECETSFDMKFFGADGTSYNMSYQKYCELNGDLKIGEVLDGSKDYHQALIESGEYQSWWAKKQGNKWVICEEGEEGAVQYIPKIEQDFKGCLDLVARRIPTERNYSMMRLKIKRFTPMAFGATIKVPAEGTVIAGFDFDIDKLYLMRKEFRLREFSNKLSDNEVEQIWEMIYDANPDVKAALQAKAGITSKELANTVMSEDKLDELISKGLLTEADRQKLTSSQDRLYKFWDAAHLPGRPSDTFKKFVDTNIDFLIEKFGKNRSMFEEYDGTKAAKDNTRVARNNMLFELFLRRLEDEETLASRLTPGGFEDAKDAAAFIITLSPQTEVDKEANKKVLEGNPDAFEAIMQRMKGEKRDLKNISPTYEYSEIETLIYYNKQNQIADKEIGVFANHNITHAYLTTFDTVELSTPVAFGKYWDSKFGGNADGYGLHDLIQRAPREGAPTRELTEKFIAECLAASVDAVKSPVLNYLNINTFTANTAALLARLGYDFYDIGLLLNQPIIHEMIRLGQLSSEGPDVVLKRMNAMADQILHEAQESYNVNEAHKELNRSNLTKAIINNDLYSPNQAEGESKPRFTVSQAKVLKLFFHLHSAASSLSDLTTLTKMSASNSVGSTLAFFKAQELNVEKNNAELNKEGGLLTVKKGNRAILSNSLDIDSDDYLSKIASDPACLEQCFYDTNRAIMKLFAPLFPYTHKNGIYDQAANMLNGALRVGNMTENMLNYAWQDVLTYMMSSVDGSMFNPYTKIMPLNASTEGMRDAYGVEAGAYFKSQFALDFANFQRGIDTRRWNAILEAFPILSHLYTEAGTSFDNTTVNADNNDQRNKQLEAKSRTSLRFTGMNLNNGVSARQEIKESWADMMDPSSCEIFPTEGVPTTTANRNREVNEELRRVLPRLASYLIYYTHFTAGNAYTFNSFIVDAPSEVLSNIETTETIGEGGKKVKETYGDYLKLLGMQDNKAVPAMNLNQMKEFLTMFIQNHTDFYQLVQTIRNNDVIKDILGSDAKAKDSFTIQYIRRDDSGSPDSKSASDAVFSKKEKDVQYPPAIVMNGTLYVADFKTDDRGLSFVISETEASQQGVTYYRKDRLGTTDLAAPYNDATIMSEDGKLNPQQRGEFEKVENDLRTQQEIDDIIRAAIDIINNNDDYATEAEKIAGIAEASAVAIADRLMNATLGSTATYPNSTNGIPVEDMGNLSAKEFMGLLLPEVLTDIIDAKMGETQAALTKEFITDLFNDILDFKNNHEIENTVKDMLSSQGDDIIIQTFDENGNITILCR